MRAKGQGTVRRRPDGRWEARVHTPEGRRVSVYGATQTQALERARDAAGRGVPHGTLTVAAWLQRWVETCDRRPSTVAGYTSKVKRISAVIGRRRLAKLTPDDISRAWRLLGAELSPSSVRHCHRVLHAALAEAVRQGVLVRNPASLVRPPRVPNVQAGTALTVPQVRTLLQVAAARRHGVRWWIALLLGLRQGEALGLGWDVIDLERGLLVVRRALQRVPGNGLELVEPKTARSVRVLPLPGPLATMLQAHRDTQHAERMYAGSVWRQEWDPLAWRQPNGAPISPEMDWHDWHQLLAAAGLPKVRVHDCRHTCASLLAELGVPARVASEILGHSTITMTLSTYTHVGDPAMVDAIGRMAHTLTPDLTPHLTPAGTHNRAPERTRTGAGSGKHTR